MIRTRRAAAYRPWLVLVALSLTLIVATWVIGPWLVIGNQAVLAAWTARLLVTLLVLLVSVIAAMALLLRGRPGNGASSVETASVDTYERQSQSLERALHRVLLMQRQIRGATWRDRSYPYLVPWYVVAGPKGAGKTSLIQGAGLNFGGAGQRRNHVAGGPGYTLSLSDKAAFVDTSGLLGNQLDRRVWRHFLGLLRRHRRQQPANGVILTLGLPEFRAATQGQARELAGDIRQQLGEMVAQLGVRLPIYVVFTKLDELPGFSAFFDDATAFPRDGVLGITFPLFGTSKDGVDPETVSSLFDQSFDELVHWHMRRTLERVNSAGETASRFDAFMFLPELAALKGKFAEFVDEVFKPSQFEETLLLRGLYFTSARPQADKVRLPLPGPTSEHAVPAEVATPQAGMFIRDLLDKVIFPEAGLAGLNARARRVALAKRSGLLGATAVLAVAMILWWAVSFVGNTQLIESVRAMALQARSALALTTDATGSRSGDEAGDIVVTLAALKSLQTLSAGLNAPTGDVPLSDQGGLSQHDRLAAAAHREYVKALRQLLLPRVKQMAEDAISGSESDANELYGSLMVYLMLGDDHAIEPAVVLGWTRQRCGQLYAGAANRSICSDYETQLESLLRAGFDPIALDASLIARARATLNAFSPALRGMALLGSTPAITSLPPVVFTDVIGPLAPYALVRRSGRSLAESIPGLYTASAFSTVVLPEITKIATQVIREDWVRYSRAERNRNPAMIDTLRRDMIDLYVGAYVARWENLLDDIDIAPFADFSSEFAVLQALSGPPSPYRAFLNMVSQNTLLTQTTNQALSAAATKQGLVLVSDADAAPARTAVTDHFAVLHRFLAGSPSALDALMSEINQLRSMIGPVASAGGAVPSLATELTSTPAFAQTLSQLQLGVVSAPPPVADSVNALVRRTSAIANDSVRSDVNAAWKAQVLPFCQSAINGRYPFANSRTDVTIADFSRMFAPGGLLDQFFTRQLKPFIDTSASPWKLLANAGVHPNVSAQSVRYFEEADRIRTIFFPPGATTPKVSFAITPLELDPQAMRVTLDVDGQALTYEYGPQQAVAMSWPGTTGDVRVGFGANDPGQPSFTSVTGPWALFRFLAAHKPLKPIGNNDFSFKVTLGAHTAGFALQAATVDNPFRQNAFSGFRCLPSLIVAASARDTHRNE